MTVMTRLSVWVAGQDLAPSEQVCWLAAWCGAARTGGILGTELVRTLWAPARPSGAHMGGGGEG